MKVVIIEDESEAAERLIVLLKKNDPLIEVLAVIPSVEESIEWLDTHSGYELIFMDVHLSDGLSFEIIKTSRLSVPIIFTTAYDAYALKAFKANSIDYLLKPVNAEELQTAIAKFRQFYQKDSRPFQELINYIQTNTKPSYKTGFLVNTGIKMKYISVSSIAYFRADGKIVTISTHDDSVYYIEETIEKLVTFLNPDFFFRINRSYIIHIDAINDMQPYFNGRLVINLKPAVKEKVIVSRQRVNFFKAWLNK